MLEQTTIQVGDDEFVLEQFPSTPGLKYGIKVGRIFGTMLAGGFDNDIQEGGDLLDQLDISKMITGLLSQLHDDETPRLIKAMIRDSIKKPHWSDEWYEDRFAGRFGDMAQVLMVILMDNFGDVLEIAKKKFQAARPPTPPKSSAPSTGENGGSPQDQAESTGSFFDQSPQGFAR